MKLINDTPGNFDNLLQRVFTSRGDMSLFGCVPDIVCFDLFGTVIDSLESDRTAIRKILGHDIQFPLANGKSLWNSFGDFVGKKNAKDAKSKYIMQLQTNIMSGDAKPFPAISPVFNYLFALGTKIILITNRDHNAVLPLFFKYPDMFRLVHTIGYTKDEGLPQKPDPISFMKTLEKANLKQTDNMIMIGDAVSDITFARNCGMCPVMFGHNPDHNTPQYQKTNQDIFNLPHYHMLESILVSKFKGGHEDYKQRYINQANKNWYLSPDEIFIDGYTDNGYTNEQFARIYPNGRKILQNIKQMQKQKLFENFVTKNKN